MQHLTYVLILFIFCPLMGEVVKAQQNISTSAISGIVIDQAEGTPLVGAHVFLSGTAMGTSTNHAGEFNLSPIPPGNYTITVSMIGYSRTSRDIRLEPGRTLIFRAELEPVIYNLGELYVGNLDKKWERHLRRFEDLFLGFTARADSVTILNPEVLRFETRWWGKFTAQALAPLQIENRATGYTVTYHLDEFTHSGIVTRWDGDSFFTALAPADSSQALYWEKQRRDAFSGSLRHFLLSLIHGELEEQNFSVYLKSGNRAAYHHSNRRRRTNRDDILNRSGDDNDGDFHLRFYGNLEVVYRDAPEENRYPRWADENRGPASVQTSVLTLNERPVTIDLNGEIEEPYGLTRMGYMAFMRFAEALPREYRPESSTFLDAKEYTITTTE